MIRAKLTLPREFLNEPGHAVAFAVTDIHSIEYGDDTFFIRVTALGAGSEASQARVIAVIGGLLVWTFSPSPRSPLSP